MTPSFYGLRADRNLLRPYLAKFADLGVHPVDGTGVRTFHVGSERLEWFRFFEVVGNAIDWKDFPQMRNEFDQVRRDLVEASLETIAQTIFNKTYFSLEETGLGYPTVPLSAVKDVAEQDTVAAYITSPRRFVSCQRKPVRRLSKGLDWRQRHRPQRPDFPFCNGRYRRLAASRCGTWADPRRPELPTAYRWNYSHWKDQYQGSRVRTTHIGGAVVAVEFICISAACLYAMFRASGGPTYWTSR